MATERHDVGFDLTIPAFNHPSVIHVYGSVASPPSFPPYVDVAVIAFAGSADVRLSPVQARQLASFLVEAATVAELVSVE